MKIAICVLTIIILVLYRKICSLQNELQSQIKNNQNVIIIALDTPYDYLAYGSTVNNYICIYGYQKVSTIALTKYLNGEFEATGVLPVNKDLFK